jgi:hypothetical protein
MTARLAFVMAAVLLAATPTAAEPMKCSNEEQACVAACRKAGLDPRTMATCIGNCNRRQAGCRQTGCWDNGARFYCGLLRQ